MSKDTEEKSPYGAGFVAACIVVGAVLICGVVIIVAGGGRSRDASPAAQQPLVAAPAAQPSQPSQPTKEPATPVGAATQTNNSGNQRRMDSCGLPAGDQAVP